MNNDDQNPTERLLDYFTDVAATACAYDMPGGFTKDGLLELLGHQNTSMEIALNTAYSEEFHSSMDPELKRKAIYLLDKLLTVGNYPSIAHIVKMLTHGYLAYTVQFSDAQKQVFFDTCQQTYISSPVLLVLRLFELLDKSQLDIIFNQYD